ncbi:7172_t:CDS:2 [Dentiscutata erythropus]|uniref:7172_t:CDS:1 n=1 Tax=Dentiscutata erythropus TaxID=1348616 RepID=A0A9N9F412_9GLOM|nr:7172_t:CDS:2 [Dentiscutata erythropus]
MQRRDLATLWTQIKRALRRTFGGRRYHHHRRRNNYPESRTYPERRRRRWRSRFPTFLK